MKLPDKVYSCLKWLALLCLPAVAEFIGWLFPAWGIANGDLIAQTIQRVALLIGILIGVSQINFNKNNTVTVTPIEEKK